jgi:hypothetical protein
MVSEPLKPLSDATKETHAWLQNYCSTTDVHGWMNPGIVNFLRLAATATENKPGGALEIGVHHGKFFIAINSIVQFTDSSVAIDLYERGQAQNIDDSGRGNLAQFKANLLQHDRHGGNNVTTYEADSTTLAPTDILALSGGKKFRIVSIDGGHTAEHTTCDLKLAEQVVDGFGFVFVDDFLNPHWLGVIDGVTNYLRSRPTLWPVAHGFNKLVMCKMSAHSMHFSFFKKNQSFKKTTQLCGYDILAI